MDKDEPFGLTADRVTAVFRDCLHTDDESLDGAVIVEGIINKSALHPERLASHRAEIAAMLAELPDEFRKSGGGGWSFLNACDDRNGRQWTGLHQTMDQLFQLGIASGLAAYLMPREMWAVMPGGMPYIVVTAAGEPV